VGTPYTWQETQPGEVIPYGLAGYIYQIALIPQYEGTLALQETDVTDLCPFGNNLNLSNGRAEWAAMNASVTAVSYDLMAGKTTLTFGPAPHLGAKDFVERIRVNRGPRWFNLNGNNVTNDPNSQNNIALGSDVTKAGHGPGPKALSSQFFPNNLSDAVTYAAGQMQANTYTQGAPGISIDARSSGQPNYFNSGWGSTGGPAIFLGAGSAGVLGSQAMRGVGAGAVDRMQAAGGATSLLSLDTTFTLQLGDANGNSVRLATSELPGGLAIKFQQVTLYYCNSGVLTTKTAYVLMSTPV
jgi:hypothetical protein